MILIPKTNQVRIGLLESLKKYRNHNAGSVFLSQDLSDYSFVRFEGTITGTDTDPTGFMRIGVNGAADDMFIKILGIAQTVWLVHNQKIPFSVLPQFEITIEYSFHGNMATVEFTAQQSLNVAINPLKAYGVIRNLPYPRKIEITHTQNGDIILQNMNLYGVKAE